MVAIRVGTALDLLVQACQWAGAEDLAAVLEGKVHMRQHVGLAVVDDGGRLGSLAPQLIGDTAQGLSGTGVIGLNDGLGSAAETVLCCPFGT